MSISDEFLDYILDQFARWGGVTSRKMFGGAGLYRDGRIFGLISDDVLYLKVDDANRQQYVDAGASPFAPKVKGKAIVMPYYEVPSDVMEMPERLIQWAQQSLEVGTE